MKKEAHKEMIIKTFKKDMVFIGLLLAFCIVMMFVNFLYTQEKDKHDKQYLSMAEGLRVLSQGIAKEAAIAVDGRIEGFKGLRVYQKDFDKKLTVLILGDNESHLPPSVESIQKNELQTLTNVWAITQERVGFILKHQEWLLSFFNHADKVRSTLSEVQTNYRNAAEILLKNKASMSTVMMVVDQAALSQKLAYQIDQLSEGKNSETMVSTLTENIEFFERKSKEIFNLKSNQSIHPLITSIENQMISIKDGLNMIKNGSEELVHIQKTAFEISQYSNIILLNATKLVKAYVYISEIGFVGERTGYMFGATAILLFVWLFYRGYSNARAAMVNALIQHRSNQAAVWRLLDELKTLGRGDLTVRVTVSEDITGAIAESVNYAVNTLKKLVFTINRTALLMSTSVTQTGATATHLVEATDYQAKEIVRVTAAISAMAQSIEDVSMIASKSSTVATESVETAKNGAQLVQKTMKGMDKIKQMMQETSVRIQRLGDSTQEIGNIIALINDIADQTQILALNASIQAAMAGEAGRGFAVVAEEVQHLAEKATTATKQIEDLVHAIQKDTKETAQSVDQTTLEVDLGSTLAQDAGVALVRIEEVSFQLAELIGNISMVAKQQADTSSAVSETMEVIKGITTETAEGTENTALSIAELSALANKLRDSVSGFKLPIEDENDKEAQG